MAIFYPRRLRRKRMLQRNLARRKLKRNTAIPTEKIAATIPEGAKP